MSNSNGLNGQEVPAGVVMEDDSPDEAMTPPVVTVTPDMLYKLSKKIAQLTKVIYSLNTRNDDLEVDLEAVRHSCEEKLQILTSETKAPVINGGNNHE